MREHKDISDAQWVRIKPLLPPPAPTGRPRADDRRTIDGVLYVLAKGCRWRDLPERYGSHITCWRRHRGWSQDGTWDRITAMLGAGDAPVRRDSATARSDSPHPAP